MSQFYISDGGTPGTPGIETLTGNTGGAVSPDASFNVNVVGDTTTGITVTGNPGTNTLTISSTGGNIGTATTVGAATADVITVSMGTTPGVTQFWVLVAGFDSANSLGAGYSISAAVRTTGAAATLTNAPDVNTNEEASLVAASATVVVSANNAIVRVTGVAAHTINWKATLTSVNVT